MVQGVRVESTAFTVVNVDGCVFPTVEIYHSDDTPVGIEQSLVEDSGFVKIYQCKYAF